MAQNVIETKDLTVYYGSHRGIRDVNLVVEQGEVFGFLGPNGAGKTTTQRVLLDIIRPTTGTASMFGLDCQREGPAIRKRIGYLPGELNLYSNMTGSRFFGFMESLERRDVSTVYREELCERLDLDPSRRIKEYSRGNKQKIGVIAAFMSKPDLIVLDEPTSGLDPLIQHIVMDLVREAKADGRTVFFSSHILQEVQSVCDRVGIIREGALIKTERVETLTTQRFKRLRLTFKSAPPPDLFAMDGVTETGRDGLTVHLVVRTGLQEVLERAARQGVDDLDTEPVTLEEVFLAFYGRGTNGGRNA